MLSCLEELILIPILTALIVKHAEENIERTLKPSADKNAIGGLAFQTPHYLRPALPEKQMSLCDRPEKKN